MDSVFLWNRRIAPQIINGKEIMLREEWTVKRKPYIATLNRIPRRNTRKYEQLSNQSQHVV